MLETQLAAHFGPRLLGRLPQVSDRLEEADELAGALETELVALEVARSACCCIASGCTRTVVECGCGFAGAEHRRFEGQHAG
jgi:hypothetical protein